jgi:hypothetical protein
VVNYWYRFCSWVVALCGCGEYFEVSEIHAAPMYLRNVGNITYNRAVQQPKNRINIKGIYVSISVFIHNSGTTDASLFNRNQQPTLYMNVVNSNQADSHNIVCLRINYHTGILTDVTHCASKQLFYHELQLDVLLDIMKWTVITTHKYFVKKLLNRK